MNKKIKLVTACLFFLATIQATAQSKPTPADKFFEYFNAHDVENLDLLLSDDFVLYLRYSDKIITKKELLGPYMNYNTAFNVQYTTIAEVSPEIITVSEYDDKNRILDVKDPGWSFLIESEKGKVTGITMGTLKGADDYFKELNKKEKLFREWAEQRYGSETIEQMDRNVTYYRGLMNIYGLVTANDSKMKKAEVVVETKVDSVTVGEADYGMPCSHFGKLSLKQRLARYPFNKAKSVLLISFTDTITYYGKGWKDRIPPFGNINSKITLNKTEIDQLSDLLFNVGYDTSEIFVLELTECPERKHAIVFLDAKGAPFDFISIFFGCNAMETKSDKIKLPVTCDEKYGLLKQFFSERGIPVTGF